MSRYFVDRQKARPRSYDDAEYSYTPSLKTITVLEGNDVVDTGLLDKDGNAIKRFAKDEIGFIRWNSSPMPTS